MSFFSEQESVDLREARAQVVELVGRELALREENARLRQRVEELEREKVDGEFVCVNAARAEAAEAKLAEAQEARDQAQQASGRLMDEVERLRAKLLLQAEHHRMILLKSNQQYIAEVAQLRNAVKLALDLFENGLIDFPQYGLSENGVDSDIAALYRAALAPEVK